MQLAKLKYLGTLLFNIQQQAAISKTVNPGAEFICPATDWLCPQKQR